MLDRIKRYAPAAISAFAAAVFLDSLRYKFTDHPKTQEIFGRLDGWAGSLGLPGLFGHTGLFSQYVIGTAELAASTLLLVGLLPRFARLNALGAAIGFAVMTGAVSFHLFTPLGVDPNNDGGGLFAAACTIWVSAIALLIIRRNEIAGLAADLGRAFVPTARQASPRVRAAAHALGN
ncbi:MAG: hypothetical protein NW206_17390 [Hyphomonadaceae bacterium]|nr:hypothetical protein [Hyphomonadaceae bacterium]